MVLQDTTVNLALPSAKDPEDQIITFKIYEVGKKVLPSFITYSSS
jgi:hypothetical protein